MEPCGLKQKKVSQEHFGNLAKNGLIQPVLADMLGPHCQQLFKWKINLLVCMWPNLRFVLGKLNLEQVYCLQCYYFSTLVHNWTQVYNETLLPCHLFSSILLRNQSWNYFEEHLSASSFQAGGNTAKNWTQDLPAHSTTAILWFLATKKK